MVKPKFHQAFHRLFGNDSPEEIAKKLTLVWCDPAKYFVVVPRKKRKPLVIKDGNVRILIRVYRNGTSEWAEAKAQLKGRS